MWTCQRRAKGVVCKHVNESRAKKCAACQKPRPKKRQPAHRAALKLTYEQYIEINGGEFCGVCRCGPTNGRRLDRDHDHEGTGKPRGLLCRYHNRLLKRQITLDEARRIVDYLERAERMEQWREIFDQAVDPPASTI